ncbi:FAD-binding domain protein [Ceratobasidium sp. AG-Ba]|nr:FAD-binding domain protein [Ceratobasidium sp. AG-Ba]
MPIVEPRFPVFNYTITCINIARSVSKSSNVYYFGHPQYIKGNMHWASSSSQISACVVEPGNVQDLSTILKIVSNTSTPFGIRSGGHATNPGFSSTPGVQIVLFKLNEVTYHPAPVAADGSVGTVDIGSGLVWDDVYKTLQSQNVTVLAEQSVWSDHRYRNGFRGCTPQWNHYYCVCNYEPRSVLGAQGLGGLTTYTEGQLAKLNNAVVDFVKTVTDPKASIIPAYNSIIGQPGVSLLMFYDGPTPPVGIFERFLSIPHFTSDVKTRSFTSLVQASPSDITYGTRGAFNTVSLKTYSSSLIEQVLNQTKFWGQKFAFEGALFISYDVEPFLQTMTSRSKGGAYPHDNFLMPLNLYYAWLSDTKDKMFTDAMEESAQVIYNQAVAEGQDIAGLKQIKYGNYAPASSAQDLRSIYGDNLPRLKQLKAQYDPTNIMGLAGGFRF